MLSAVVVRSHEKIWTFSLKPVNSCSGVTNVRSSSAHGLPSPLRTSQDFTTGSPNEIVAFNAFFKHIPVVLRQVPYWSRTARPAADVRVTVRGHWQLNAPTHCADNAFSWLRLSPARAVGYTSDCLSVYSSWLKYETRWYNVTALV